MTDWSIQQAKEVYNISHWSDGYFDISDDGKLLAFPDGRRDRPGIELLELTQAIRAAGLTAPILVRFTDILKHRFDGLRNAFMRAMQEYEYQGTFTGVYPIKVNQQRRVVEQILQHGGNRVGLEAGSKPELMAVLALSQKANSLIICNGYKDREYIRLALIGQRLGHQVYLILEKQSELDVILEEAKKMNVKPNLGIRVRLSSMGAGKWQNTGGEKSKFGLHAYELLQLIERLKQANLLNSLKLTSQKYF